MDLITTNQLHFGEGWPVYNTHKEAATLDKKMIWKRKETN